MARFYRFSVFCLLLLLSRGLTAQAQTNQGIVPDSTELRVLRQFYYATGGDNWYNHIGWPTTPAAWQAATIAAADDWSGIIVEGGDVIFLAIEYNHLTGTIPAALGRLSALQSLDFRGNYLLGGTIPAELGQLSLLQDLDFSITGFSGTIPAELGQLSALRTLSLSGTQLSGTIPEALGQLRELQDLDLSSNQLTGIIPVALGQLNALQYLVLTNNRLTGPIPTALGQLSALQSLSLSLNQLSGTIPATLGQLNALQYLVLSSNQLNGAIPVELSQLSALQSLSLDHNQLTGSIPSVLSRLNVLSRLDFNSNQLTGTIPATLGQLSKLKYLIFSSNQLSGTIPVELSQLSALQGLYFDRNLFNFKSLESLFTSSGLITHALLGYSPQNTPPGTDTTTYTTGQPLALTRSLGGRHTHCQWQRQAADNSWQNLAGQTDSVYRLPAADVAAQGLYRVQATNDWVTNLTLTSKPVYAKAKKGKVAYLPPNNPSDDLNRNWTLTRRFDADGNVVGESKQFLDELGRPTQAQTRNLTAKHVLASQTIYGSGGVAVLSTLPAPIDNQAFRYKEHFATAGGQDYGPANFENGKASQPDPLDEATPGTLGYYYSQNNLWEPTTPATHNPYSLTEPGDGPSGGLRRAAGPGDELAMGKGHEARARQLPLLNELTHYLSLRGQFVPTAAGATLAYRGTKSVSVDANGRETVAFADQDGQVLAACLSGPQYPGLTLTGSLSASPGPSGPPRYQDIHVPAAGSATLTLTGGGTVSVRNLITGQESQSSGAATLTLAPGFYRLLSLSGAQSFSYLARYGEFSYSYYDDADRAVAAVAPRGTATATAGQLPQFVTRNVYSGVGTLLSTTSPDEGTTQYVYARDGRIRFSQSARQKLESKFSYSNYDAVGRVVESGEYGGGGRVFESQLTDAPASNGILGLVEDRTPGGGLSASNCTQRNLVQYDLPAADAPRPQEFVLGAVARTSNAATTTWYSYDALGRLAWLAQALPGVGTKIVDYTYDFNGNVLEVAYQKGQPDAFYHHYQYDADQRLLAVATSPDGLAKTPQARYDYYLHGPLKRTELAGNLQGIDYAYTVQGWLKSINSAARGLDPGQDAPRANSFYKDLFGLTLDYFAGDYRSAAYRPAAPAVAGVPTRYDGLVRAAGWFAASSPEQRLHSYEYDAKSQLTEAHYGTVTGNVFAAGRRGRARPGGRPAPLRRPRQPEPPAPHQPGRRRHRRLHLPVPR